MRILFTGGRNFQNAKAVKKLLDHLSKDKNFEVVVGDATGFDQIVREWCDENLLDENNIVTCEVFYADWDKYGNAAGPIRNQAMVDFEPNLCIAGPGGVGTRDCVDKCHAAGIPVLRLEP